MATSPRLHPKSLQIGKVNSADDSLGTGKVTVKLDQFKHMFVVMKAGQLDMKELLNGVPKT